MRVRTRFTPLILILTAAAGCSVPGADSPAGEPGSSVPQSSSRASPQPGSAPETDLAAIEACELLTPEEATSLGAPAHGEAEVVLGLRRCDRATAENTVSTAIDEELGIDELTLADASSVTDITIGRHQAKRVVEGSGPGYCKVYFAVGDSANVSVLALYPNDTTQACAVVDQAAALIEPKPP